MKFLLAAVLALAAAPAAAQSRGDGRQLLDEGAALVVRGEPEELERLAALVRSLGGEASQLANLLSIGSAATLGFDLLSRAGWRVVGLDPARPFFLQVSPAAGPVRHARVVARVAGEAEFTAWSRRIPTFARVWRAGGAAGDLSAVLGLKAGAPEVARALAGAQVAAVGWSSLLRVHGFLRRDGDLMVLDLFTVRGRALDWSRDGDQVLARIRPPRRSLLVRRGAALELGKPGVALWTRPGGLFDLLAEPAELACRDLAAAARPSGLIDLAMSASLHRGTLSLTGRYGLSDAAPLVAALATVDDRLATSRPGDAALAATLYTGALDKLRAVPRDPAIRAGWMPVRRRLRACGRAIRVELALFAWPELAGQWLDEAGDLSPGAADLIASVRNVGLAARSLSLKDIRSSVAFAEVSMIDRGKPAARALLDAVFGAGRTARRPQRHTAWGAGRLRPYALGPRGLSILGAAFGDRSLGWRLKRGRARRADPVLGVLTADGGLVLGQIAPDLPPRLAAIGKAAAGRVGSVRGELTLARDFLGLATRIEIR